jgi:hypothetical protein
MGWWMAMFSSCGWQAPILVMAPPEALAADTGIPPAPPPEDPEPGAPTAAEPVSEPEPVPAPDPNHPTDPTM